ncbi:MAG: hypothetical protein B0D92_08425 [Spirochaeta sp. LUC14_002_19_P3]|nr:MAG: hypothetical protein B0D92_08425 [Spirochaeta sp. LUC14_002_19_P3]
MAKISNEAKRKYFQRITSYKKTIERLTDKETQVEKTLKDSDPDRPYKLIELSEDNLTVISIYNIINSLSLVILGIKNESALNDARKTCYKAIIHLEHVFTNYIDVPFSEYSEALQSAAKIPEFKRYELIRKIGFSIDQVRDALGENSRWKYSLVELDSRLAILARNNINLRTIIEGMDPRVEGYRIRIEFLNLTIRMLENAAVSYRKKYELSTGRMDDFKTAINYLSAQRRLASTLGRIDEAAELKRKIDIWREKMENDDKNKTEKERQQRLQQLKNPNESTV